MTSNMSSADVLGLAMDESWIVPYLQQQRLVMDYMSLSAAALFVYDYLLTLRPEIKLIWYSPWSYTKVLFLLIRYLTFVDTFVILHNQIVPDLSVGTCSVAFPIALWVVISKMFLAEVVLAIRTWAVWNGNKVVGIGLVVVTLVNLVLQCTSTVKPSRRTEYLPPLYPGFRGCFSIPLNGALFLSNYISWAVVEAVVFALMSISAYRSYKLGYMGEFSRVIHRDGIMFYVALLFISTANVVIPAVSRVNRLDRLTMLAPLEEVFYSVLTTRIMLNIRKDWHRGAVQVELHTGHRHTQLVFARHHDEHSQDSSVRPQQPPMKSQAIASDDDKSVV